LASKSAKSASLLQIAQIEQYWEKIDNDIYSVNLGLGKSLMKKLMDYIKTNAKSGAFIGLMAAKGLERYYEPFGFKARDRDAPGMYQVIK
jgi:hypothetical protein